MGEHLNLTHYKNNHVTLSENNGFWKLERLKTGSWLLTPGGLNTLKRR